MVSPEIEHEVLEGTSLVQGGFAGFGDQEWVVADGVNGHEPFLEQEELPYVPPAEQMGLLGQEFLPLSHRRPEAVNGELDLIMEEEEVSGEIRQGVFEKHSIASFNTVVQQRKIYEDIETLAGNIQAEGLLIHPILVARYTTPEAARMYLIAAYSTVGKKIPQEQRKRLIDLVQTTHNDQPAWLIVIAGHRRLRALEMLGEEDSVVQVIDNMHPLKALKVQVSENTSRLPKDFERAEQNGDLWMVEKAMNPNLTIEEFAKSVGHKPEVVRRDLLYYGLPDSIKNYVVPRNQQDTGKGNTKVPDQPLMAFRVACQLGRLVEAGAAEHDILFLARRFWDDNVVSEKAARIRVNTYLNAFRQGQVGMRDLFETNFEKLAEFNRIREAAGRFASPADAAASYFARVFRAKKEGFPTDEDAVSFAGAGTRIRNLIGILEEGIPYMRDQLTPAESRKARRVLRRARSLAEEFVRVGDIDTVDPELDRDELSP